MSKTKLTLSMEEQKVKELKKKAIDADMTLSEYLSRAGTNTPIDQIQNTPVVKSEGGRPPQG